MSRVLPVVAAGALLLGCQSTPPSAPEDKTIAAAKTASPPPAATEQKKAAPLAGGASPVEKAFIGALVKRYAEKPPEDRAPLDLAYANAMREVAAQYPQDPDLLALAPWSYWQPDGSPKDFTVEAIEALEIAMALSSRDPGAVSARFGSNSKA